MLKIPKILMDYIKELNEVIGPYHWNEKINTSIPLKIELNKTI
jgi:hypothetical protein